MPDNSQLVYELVYRRFARAWIHEITFDANPEKKSCSWSGHDAATHWPFGRNLCGYLEYGWPEPEQEDQNTRSFMGIVWKRVFMDDLFLCPNCGRFHQIDGQPKSPNYSQMETDWSNFQVAIESRIGTKEFYIKRCEDKNDCSKIRERSLKELKSARESERNWPKQLPATPALQKPQIANPPKVEISDREISVYVIEGNSLYKIGIATDISKRIAGIQTSCPFELKVVKVWKSKFPHKAERHLHKRFKSYRMKGEWFRLPSNEIETLLQIANLDELLSQ